MCHCFSIIQLRSVEENVFYFVFTGLFDHHCAFFFFFFRAADLKATKKFSLHTFLLVLFPQE